MTKAISSAVNGDESVQVSEDKVTVVSSQITAEELLDLIVETTEEYPIAPGKYATIRSLTYAEAKQLFAQNKGNREEVELSALLVGTVFPKLTEEHLAALRKGKPGPLMNMAKRIMVISGMIDDDKNMGEDGASS